MFRSSLTTLSLTMKDVHRALSTLSAQAFATEFGPENSSLLHIMIVLLGYLNLIFIYFFHYVKRILGGAAKPTKISMVLSIVDTRPISFKHLPVPSTVTSVSSLLSLLCPLPSPQHTLPLCFTVTVLFKRQYIKAYSIGNYKPLSWPSEDQYHWYYTNVYYFSGEKEMLSEILILCTL